MKTHLTIYTLIGLAIFTLLGSAAAQQPQMEEATFYVT